MAHERAGRAYPREVTSMSIQRRQLQLPPSDRTFCGPAGGVGTCGAGRAGVSCGGPSGGAGALGAGTGWGLSRTFSKVSTPL
jgi:hypothetical protein